MEREILSVMLRYAHEAGSIAIAEQSNLQAVLKPDDTYVTGVDMRLSELALRTFTEVVPERQIITEEHIDNLLDLVNGEPAGDGELLLIVDPIDGTRNYFHNMPLYGISVGVLRNLQPWLGVVTFPGLGETLYCTGDDAYMITRAYDANPVERRLNSSEDEVKKNSQVLLANSFARAYRWNYKVCTILLTACVTINSCWPTLRRGIGAVFMDHIWDLAGSWPILQQLGFELRGVETGKVMTHYHRSDYDPESHRVREPMIISRPQHYRHLREGVIRL